MCRCGLGSGLGLWVRVRVRVRVMVDFRVSVRVGVRIRVNITLTLTKTQKLNPNLLPYWECCRNMVREKNCGPGASFFPGVYAWLAKVLGQFSIIYFRGLGLRIGVRV